MSNIIDGKSISNQIILSLNDDINKYSHYGKPSLAVVQVGNKLESSVYIKKKCEACSELGFYSEVHKLGEDATDDTVINLINKLNINKRMNGILVQLPLPKHLNEAKILNHIAYDKDVDGFHAQNMGELAMKYREPAFIPCTPQGCLKLLEYENIKIRGAHVVVIGNSNIVGLPMSLLLLKEGATVTVCHIDTKDLKLHTKQADIIITACGQPEMIKKEWVKPGVVIIDVGTNFIPDSTKKSGRKLVGDVDFNDVKDIAYKISPVPGGVGPLTVAMLLLNTFKAFKIQNGFN